MGIVTSKFVDNLLQFGFVKATPTELWVHPEEDAVIIMNKIDDNTWEIKTHFPHIRFKSKDNSIPGYMRVMHNKDIYYIHVLKALAFIPMKDELKLRLKENFNYKDLYKSRITVNHKDGDKFNNNANNLEWVTYKENLEHAFMTGLRTDNHFGCAFDVVENKEIYFYSINQLGKEINIHPDYISRYLKGARLSLLANRYMVRKVEEKDYPHKLTYDDIWKSSLAGITPIEITDTKKGKVMEFGSYSEATKKLKLNPIRKSLFKDKDTVYKIKEFEFRPICDYNRIMKIKKKHDKIKYESLRTNRQIKKPLKVKVTLTDNSVIVFESRKKAAEYFKLSDVALKARLHKYNGLWKGNKFEYIVQSS